MLNVSSLHYKKKNAVKSLQVSLEVKWTREMAISLQYM